MTTNSGTCEHAARVVEAVLVMMDPARGSFCYEQRDNLRRLVVMTVSSRSPSCCQIGYPQRGR